MDVSRHLLHGYSALLPSYALCVGGRILTGHARSQHGQRLGTDILAELEVLKEAQATRLMVAPDVEVRLAILQRAYGVVPMVDILKALAMTHAATGEAHELRLQVGNHLCQVFSQTVLSVLERLLREETDEVDARCGLLQADQR